MSGSETAKCRKLVKCQESRQRIEEVIMESRAKFLGHPIHQQLIVFPLGLLGMAVIFDVVTLLTKNPRWTETAFYMIGAGIVSGLLAAIFGLIDWAAIPRHTRAKSIGTIHGVGNVVVVLLFIGSFYFRWQDPSDVSGIGYGCSFAGFCIALFTGWLGGELVDRLGVGVDDGANLDAPSSLRTRSARHRPAA
jgi:uncharacterized membrane protein